MRDWILKIVFLFIFTGSCNVYAQYEYKSICIEASPQGWAYCRLKPDAFDRWSYGSGYGIAPTERIDNRYGYPTLEKAAYESLNYLFYTNPNFSYICQFSHSIGQTEVMYRDDFIESKQPVRTVTPLNYTHGWKNESGCTNISSGIVYIYGDTGPQCKGPNPHSIWLWDIGSYACYTAVEKKPNLNSCTRGSIHGNPIFGPSREKLEFEQDFVDHSPMPLEFRRTYRSHRARDKSFWFNEYYQPEAPRSLGEGWIHNHDMHLAVTRRPTGVALVLEQIRIQMGDGTFHHFHRHAADTAYTSQQPSEVLTKISNSHIAWILQDKNNDVSYYFNGEGRIVEQARRNGWKITYTYTGQKLTSIQNQFGSTLQLYYDPAGYLSSVTNSENRSVNYNHVDGLLTRVIQADGTNIQYLYTTPSSNIPALLRGKMDENGVLYSTFTYDSEGWAVSTQKAGGVDRYLVPSTSEVIDPLGTYRTHSHIRFGSELIFQGASQPDANNNQPPIYAGSINALGLVDFYYDHFYQQTSYTWDTARRLPLTITEAVGLPESRTTSTSWHPQWRLPMTVTESGRTTSYTYDSLGNPLTRTITDTNAGGAVRTTAWSYHSSGLLASETAPNGATTSYTHDGAGNITSVTNAVGHTDTYTHDGAGRVLTHTGPTGLVTTYTYDARGRVLTANRGGLLTSFTYRPSGQIATATLPHGHSITYTYDAAQRLTAWSDNRGHSGAYTLDVMGNRTREDIRNAQGQLVWRLARTINSLNRVATVTLGGQTTTYGYDNNGDWVATTNSLGQGTNQSLDALRRTKAITNAEYATATLSYNALDGVAQVSDFKGVTTTYTRDALGNATIESSPDSGIDTAQYDALGLPSSIADAVGQATTVQRDLLGRPTLITHAGGRVTSLRYDLTPASKGTLGEIVDASGTTTYQRDVHGRVTTKTQAMINGDTRSVSYGYNTQGLLASTTYPGGKVLQHIYDATGQLTGLTWAGQNLVTGITWNPLGQPTGWSWTLPGGTTAIPATRTYNTAGQLTATDFSSYQYDAAGRIHTLTQKLWRPANTNPQASTISQATSTWTVQYSPAGRITGFTKNTAANAPVDSASFEYDANGNRTASTRDVAGTSTSRSYGGDASHNRLLGFEQTATAGGNSANTSVSYQYNSAGDLLGDGLTTYRYDSEGRLESATTGEGEDSPTTKYAHNALGQRVFKTEPLYASSAAKGSRKTLNNLLADDDEDDGLAQPPGLIQQLIRFFARLWSPATSDAEKLGWSYVYDESGSLLAEYGSGGNSTGTAQYIYLPTASGPMPIAAVLNGSTYAVHSDHLNTPRKLTQADGQVSWQWAYSAFGDEQPTLGSKRFTSEATNPSTGATSIPEVTFNLRYPGQYFDKETKLHYNYFRSYDARTGRYTQGDPIGLDGGWNRFAYVGGNPLSFTDPMGLQAYMCGAAGLSAWCDKPKNPPTIGVFGCVGLACLSANGGDTSPTMSLELTLGGGLEICSPPPPPKPPEEMCQKNNTSTWQPPGIPVPERYGGLFIGPSIKRNGQICVKLGPHISAPMIPSIDMGSNW